MIWENAGHELFMHKNLTTQTLNAIFSIYGNVGKWNMF